MTIVAVPIEKEATRWDVKPQDKKMYLRFFKNQYHVNSVRLGNANKSYSILGKLSALTDEQCKVVMEKIYSGLTPFTPKESFVNYLRSQGKTCKWMTTAVEEGHDYNSLPDDFLILIKT